MDRNGFSEPRTGVGGWIRREVVNAVGSVVLQIGKFTKLSMNYRCWFCCVF